MNEPRSARATTRRLFIALRPPPALATELCERAREALDAAEWRVYGVRDVHLTLCFLGATPAERVPELIAAMTREIEPLPALDIAVGGVGAFPSTSKARALWVGVRAPRAGMEQLALLERAAFRAAHAAGLSPDERSNGEHFRPHLTLARPRIGRRSAIPERFRALDFDAPWHVDAVHLFETVESGPEIERHPSLAVVRCRGATS